MEARRLMWRLILQMEKILNIKIGLRAKIKFTVLPVKKMASGLRSNQEEAVRLFFETSEDLGQYFIDSLLGKRVLRTVRGLPIAQKRETCGCKFNLMKYNLRHVKSTKFLKE